jgi:Holliday junction resolvase RusA-like endonuclease
MLDGHIRPTKTPDTDNIAKSVLDALNKVAYKDDSCVVDLIVEKWYSENPRVEVYIDNEE